MLKVLWFIQRTPDVTAEQFRTWWLDVHGPEIVDRQKGYLRRYTIRFPSATEPQLAEGGPATVWDGVAEQWFDDRAAMDECHTIQASEEILADVAAHIGRVESLVFDEAAFVG